MRTQGLEGKGDSTEFEKNTEYKNIQGETQLKNNRA